MSLPKTRSSKSPKLPDLIHEKKFFKAKKIAFDEIIRIKLLISKEQAEKTLLISAN